MPDDSNIISQTYSFMATTVRGMTDSVVLAAHGFVEGWQMISNFVNEAIDMNTMSPSPAGPGHGPGLQQGTLNFPTSGGANGAAGSFTMEPDSLPRMLAAIEAFYGEVHHHVLPDLGMLQMVVDPRGWEGTAVAVREYLRDADTELLHVEDRLYATKQDLASKINLSRELMRRPAFTLQSLDPRQVVSTPGQGPRGRVVQHLQIPDPTPGPTPDPRPQARQYLVQHLNVPQQPATPPSGYPQIPSNFAEHIPAGSGLEDDRYVTANGNSWLVPHGLYYRRSEDGNLSDCTWYAAAAVKAASGGKIDLNDPNSGFSSWGNAASWANSAKNYKQAHPDGVVAGVDTAPRPGDVVVFSYGHVAFVQNVSLSPDGSKVEVTVTEENYYYNTKPIHNDTPVGGLPENVRRYQRTLTYDVVPGSNPPAIAQRNGEEFIHFRYQ